MKPIPAVTVAALLASGCAPAVINLTPSRTLRPSEPVHHFEVQWDSPRKGTHYDEVNAFIMMDGQLFPMNRIPNTLNRWEGNVPIPLGKTRLIYRFKFNYTYPGLTRRVESSDLTREYDLILSPQP